MTLDEINDRLAARDLCLMPAPASLPKYRFFLVPRQASPYSRGKNKNPGKGREILNHFATLEEASAHLLD